MGDDLSLPLPWGLRAWEEEGNLNSSSGPGPVCFPLLPFLADPRACWCCSAVLDFPILLSALPGPWCSSGVIFPLVRRNSTRHFLTSPYPTPPHPTLYPASQAHLYPHTRAANTHTPLFIYHLCRTPVSNSHPHPHTPHIHPTWSWTPFSLQPGPHVPPRGRRGWAFGLCPEDLESKGSRYFMLLREEISSLNFP